MRITQPITIGPNFSFSFITCRSLNASLCIIVIGFPVGPVPKISMSIKINQTRINKNFKKQNKKIHRFFWSEVMEIIIMKN